METYITRLRATGFEGMNLVLDAGCGFGQWTIALSRLNNHVLAIDKNLERVEWLQQKLVEDRITNVSVMASRLEDYKPGTARFDGIFCYGALYYTPWKEMLETFCDWLVSNGRLYATFNDIGWYFHLWRTEANKADGYVPSLLSIGAFFNTYARYRYGLPPFDGVDIIISSYEMFEVLEDLDMEFQIGDEGTIDVAGVGPESFFDGEYEGYPGVKEVLATKSV